MCYADWSFYNIDLPLIAITNSGINVAKRIKEKLDDKATLFLPQKLEQSNQAATYYSKKFSDQIGDLFFHYDGFVFIMVSGIVVPRGYSADFVVYDKIILESNAIESLANRHIRQTLNYLAASRLKLGLLVNFGKESLIHKRVIL